MLGTSGLLAMISNVQLQQAPSFCDDWWNQALLNGSAEECHAVTVASNVAACTVPTSLSLEEQQLEPWVGRGVDMLQPCRSELPC